MTCQVPQPMILQKERMDISAMRRRTTNFIILTRKPLRRAHGPRETGMGD